MPEQEQKNPATTATPAPAPSAAPAPTKQFDVALIDPHDPSILHWPRMRVTIDAASVADLAGEQQKKPPKEQAFLVGEIERQRAIVAYNQAMGLTSSMLRYDVVPAKEESAAPELPERWMKHLKNVGLA
jgi:hypothetical protein